MLLLLLLLLLLQLSQQLLGSLHDSLTWLGRLIRLLLLRNLRLWLDFIGIILSIRLVVVDLRNSLQIRILLIARILHCWVLEPWLRRRLSLLRLLRSANPRHQHNLP